MVKLRVVVFGHGDIVALVVLQSVVDDGRLPGISIGHAGDGKVYACQQRVRILRVSGRSVRGTTCAPMMDASKGISPCGIWQFMHCVSSACGPPGWLTSGPVEKPVAKSMSLWQPPQAAREGLVRNALACAPPVVFRVAEVWCGKPRSAAAWRDRSPLKNH